MEGKSGEDATDPTEEPVRQVEQKLGGSAGSGQGEFKVIIDFGPISEPDVESVSIEVAQVLAQVTDANGSTKVPLLSAPEVVTIESTTEPHRYIVGPLTLPAGSVDELAVDFEPGQLVTSDGTVHSLVPSTDADDKSLSASVQVDGDCPAAVVIGLSSQVVDFGEWVFDPQQGASDGKRFCDFATPCKAADPFACQSTPTLADLVGPSTADTITSQAEFEPADVRNIAAGLEQLDQQITEAGVGGLPTIQTGDLVRAHHALQQHYFDAVAYLDPQQPSTDAQGELDDFEQAAAGMGPEERFLLKQEMLRGLTPRK